VARKSRVNPWTALRDMKRKASLTKFELGLLIGQIVLGAFLEGIGIGLLLPVLTFIQDPNALRHPSMLFKVLILVGGFLHVPVNLATLLAMAFVPIVVRQLVYFWGAWYLALVQQRAVTRLRSKGFGAIVRGDLSFIVAEGQGNLISLLTTQISRAGNAILQWVNQIASAITIAVYVALLLALQPLLTVFTVVAMALISIIIRGNVKRSRAYGGEASRLNNKAMSTVSERLGNIRLIKMRGQEDQETEHVTTVVRDLEMAGVRIAIARAAVEITVDPALMIAAFVIIYVGVSFFHITLASLGLFLFILLRLNQKTKDYSGGKQNLAAFVDSLDLVHATIGRAHEAHRIKGGKRRFEGLKDRIDMRDVGFSYEDETDERLVLRDVSLQIPRGSLTALVGRSGAGKSTLVDLIPRLRDATHGEVLLDGVPIREFDLRTLRRRVGFMTQDALLFNTTIRENLIYGLEREPADEQIERALEAAYCLEFVDEMPDRLETMVGDRGVRMSGGQRQRLALARVFLEDPDILILDEPTSALDSESEQYIQKALDRIMGSRTVIVIAHRLSTVQRANTIYVLEGGVIVEHGTHQELLDLEGAYRKLFDLQIYS
jgi:subfamily B ATP-binding cassette protein MsbA